jgi:hypothetical protein
VLLLQRGEEALHRRVVETVAAPAHGLLDAVPLQHPTVGLGGVLPPSVAMVHQPGLRSPALQGHDQGVDAQPGPQVVGHAPADDLAGGQVLDGGQVEPALVGRQVGEVGEPDRVRPLGREAPPEEVRRDREVVPAVGGAGRPASPPAGGQAHLAHQPRHAPARVPPALAAQLGVDPRRARRPAGGRRRCGRRGRAARLPPRPGPGRWGSRAARRRSR